MSRNIIERLEDAVLSLMREILELKEEYNENQREIAFLSKNNAKNALTLFEEKSINEGRTTFTQNVNTELAHWEMDVKFVKEITGIEILKYFKKIYQKSENKVLYNHIMVGRCQAFSFKMEFKSSESPSEDHGVCQVSDVRIQMDCKDQPDLIQLVHRTETSMNLLGFFRILSNYAEWCDFRLNTFTRFKEKYSSAVKLPLGPSADCMILMSPEIPECKIMLMWKITINYDGTVVPILDLLTEIPEQVVDPSGFVDEAAQGFKNLLQVFGIEGSIDRIIQSFCFRRANVDLGGAEFTT